MAKQIIALASDHGGFKLKEEMKKYVESLGYQSIDLGPDNDEKSISYALQGHKLANYLNDPKNKVFLGLGFCGSGLGISFALNRHKKIRAARIMNVEDARLAKLHNNANVLVMAGRFTPIAEAKAMFNEFVKTDYEGGRHQQRIDDLDK